MSPSPQRATAFAKKPAVTKANRLKDGARALAEAARTQRVIPIKLALLLAPYKRHGRLSIRIERLPQLARLSAGRNNGDNSWSLTLDQLEDLNYLPPEGMDEAHILAVRIIGLDGGGSTLAVLEFPVSPGGPGPDAEDEESTAQDQSEDASENTQLRPLRAELAKMKASLIARESDLANARAALEAEQGERKFSSPSTGVLMRKGEAGPSKLTLAGDEIEMRCLRDELTAAQASLAERETALAQAGVAVEQARERWRQESEAAEIGWKAGEAARLAALEAQWQERSAKAIAEARDQAEATRDSAHQVALRRLHDDLAATQANLSNRDAALAKVGLALEQARERQQRETQEALSGAERVWKDDEAARLAAAETQWQEKSARALAEARSQAEAAHSDHAIALRRLQEDLAATQANLSNRESALAEARLDLGQARERQQRESEAALSEAKIAWKNDEAARLAAAEAKWQETSARALAETRAQSEAARNSAHEAELQRLREELAALQASSSNSKTAMAETRQALEQARKALRQESEEALSKAEKAWKADEAARLAAAEARWQEKSATALAEACGQAEKARDSRHEIELRGLREELAALQASSSNSKTAMAETRLALEQARKAWRQESEAALSKAEDVWKAAEATRLAATEARWQEKSATALAEACGQAEKARDSRHEIELRRLREELAAMQASSSNSKTAMTETRLALEQARKAWRQESEAALSKAEDAWKADEASRRAVAEAQWQETSAQTLAEATKRFEAAEAALKKVLIRTEATRESGNAIEHRRLREELAMMQASLADREAALAETRLALEHTRELPASEDKIVLRPDRMWNASERREREDERPKSFLVRDMIVVGALVVSAIVFYPRFESYLHLPEVGTIFRNASAPASLPQRTAPVAAEQNMSFVNHGGNVRSGPSPTAEVISALQRGQKVATMEQSGKWTHVRLGAESGKTEQRDGWIFSSFLDPPGGKEVSPLTEHK